MHIKEGKQSAGCRRQEAQGHFVSAAQGFLRGSVILSPYSLGIVAASALLNGPKNLCKVRPCLHGVQGVECSNHSVPTI